jgi:RNA polymerase sigma factor (sigma-70 family)
MTEGPGSSDAFEELAAGGLAAPEARAWALFDRAWPAVLGRVQVFLRSRGVPTFLREDCGQSALVRVWRFRTSYRGSTAPELAAWMYRITQNEAARAIEQWRREVSWRRPEPPGAADESLGELAQTGELPGDDAESRDALRALDQCLGGLDERQREVIELLYSGNPLSEREACGILGVSKSYVNTLRQKALAQLARCLEGKGVG